MSHASFTSPSQRAFSHYLRTGRRLPEEFFVEEQDVEFKFNPYHDPRNGRFTFAPGGARTGPRHTPGHGRPHGPAKPKAYTVRHGDTLSHIARRHGVRTDALARANGIKHPDHIRTGQTLLIPQPPPLHHAHAPRPPKAQSDAGSNDIVVVGRKLPDTSHANAPRQPPLNAGASTGKKWKTKDANVKVSNNIMKKVDQVAEDYHAATGQTLIVTDGARTPRDQAERMYYKYSHGDFSTYKGAQAARIANIYRQGKAKGKLQSQILDDMTVTIHRNLQNGYPISRHLLGRGVDFRTRDMTSAQIKILENAIKENGGRALKEGVPKHIHASF